MNGSRGECGERLERREIRRQPSEDLYLDSDEKESKPSTNSDIGLHLFGQVYGVLKGLSEDIINHVTFRINIGP
ncbi:hypothetical protein R1flu_019865 [Riccia fluitans]|uniref:Uncharacterized protein n=1 Tax=Riccia fluitans TaxID=41844 RepID=A0ABD1ZJV1_9MARC